MAAVGRNDHQAFQTSSPTHPLFLPSFLDETQISKSSLACTCTSRSFSLFPSFLFISRQPFFFILLCLIFSHLTLDRSANITTFVISTSKHIHQVSISFPFVPCLCLERNCVLMFLILARCGLDILLIVGREQTFSRPADQEVSLQDVIGGF